MTRRVSRKLGDRLKPGSAALIFEKDGVSIALPRELARGASMPEHMVACCAIGARLVADDKWRDHVMAGARKWLDGEIGAVKGKSKP